MYDEWLKTRDCWDFARADSAWLITRSAILVQFDWHFDSFLQGNLNESRLKAVKNAFKKADRSGDGVFDVKDLKRVYKVRIYYSILDCKNSMPLGKCESKMR